MRRRKFLALQRAQRRVALVSAAQQPGHAGYWLSGLGTLDEARRVFRFHQPGLVEAGYVEGRNLSVQFALPTIMPTGCGLWRTNLRQARVAAIITGSGPALGRPARRPHNSGRFFFTGFDPVARRLCRQLEPAPAAMSPVFSPSIRSADQAH